MKYLKILKWLFKHKAILNVIYSLYEVCKDGKVSRGEWFLVMGELEKCLEFKEHIKDGNDS